MGADLENIKPELGAEIRTNGALRYGILMIVLGIVLFGTLFPIFLEFDNYQNLKKPLKDGGSPLSDDFNLPLYLIASSLLLLISGVLSITSYFKNNRIIGYVSLSITFVSCLLALLCSSLLYKILTDLLEISNGNPVENADEFGEREESLMDFTAAIYNECCFPVYNSLNYSFGDLQNTPLLKEGEVLDINQKEVLECVENDIQATCPSVDDEANGLIQMFPDAVSVVLGNLGGALSILCHCISDIDRYNAFIDSFRAEGSCEKFRDIRVKDVNEREIPGVGFRYGDIPNALSLINLQEVGENNPTIDEMALVGKVISPESIYNEPEEEIGFSCGLGYAKAISLTMYFFVNDATYPATIGSFIVGSVGILASFALIGFWFCEGGQVVDTGDEYALVVEEGDKKGKKDEYDEYE